MARLADIIQESIAAVEVAGRPISTHAAARHGVAKILSDVELTYTAVFEWLAGKIQSAIKRSTRRAGLLDPKEYVMARREDIRGADAITIVPRQADFFMDPFGLNDGHKLAALPDAPALAAECGGGRAVFRNMRCSFPFRYFWLNRIGTLYSLLR